LEGQFLELILLVLVLSLLKLEAHRLLSAFSSSFTIASKSNGSWEDFVSILLGHSVLDSEDEEVEEDLL